MAIVSSEMDIRAADVEDEDEAVVDWTDSLCSCRMWACPLLRIIMELNAEKDDGHVSERNREMGMYGSLSTLGLATKSNTMGMVIRQRR